ncbi:Mg-transporting ATPase [Gautieria morchelliformis]|nr:Mg-transporting ATPase [Gautieria morchelliformis]
MQTFLATLRRFTASARQSRSSSPDERAMPCGESLDEKNVDGLVEPSVLINKRKEQNEQECAVSEKLARFSRVPASTVFNLQPGSSPLGLSDEAALLALEKHGLNIFVTERPPSAIALLFTALANPFNFILMALGIISIATGDRPTFGVMMVMITASTGLRFWQELKSVTQAARLLNSVTTRVRVLRANKEVELNRKDIVPGDVLALASGDVFPGDCVLFSSEALTVTQASLTGELMPVDKAPRVDPPPLEFEFDIIDNQNICLAGTSVATGSGRAMVVLTRDDTYMASIAKDLDKKRPLNAMQAGVRKVSYILLAFMGVMAPIVLIIQGLISKDWRSAAVFAISVAVGITPEMLPMIVASNLALSAVRVARKKVIVKRFDAIQTLGAVNILCSDKTGTLTIDLVQVSFSATGWGDQSDLPLKLAYLNAALQTGTRSPIDGAIVDKFAKSAEGGGMGDPKLEEWTKLAEVPFDSTRRLLSVLVSRSQVGMDEKGLMITKGAVDDVLDRCARVYDHPSSQSSSPVTLDKFKPSEASPLTVDARSRILETAERLNREGLRLVAVACKSSVAMPLMTLTTADETDLVFIGFLGFLDPLKPDAADAIEKLAKLGVQVRILTGDAPAVAAKVGRDLGLLPSNSSSLDHLTLHMEPGLEEKDLVITGPQLAALSNDQVAFKAALERCIIFAKLSPHQKLQVVEGLRKGGGGRAVAFLGDGVNDALAIRAADVGISVDSGTEIAKEAADVILLEKSLDVIVHGVVQGRMTFVNTIKYIKMATSSNFGNVFSVLAASAWLPYQPILPLQLLFQNLLYDFSQASIPWDNVDPEYMLTPRTWNAKSVARFMIFMGPTSSVFDICTFLINWYRYGIRTADSPLVAQAQTNWFLEGALTQIFIIHFLRTGKIPFVQSRASRSVVGLTTLIAGVVIAIPYIPKLNSALGMSTPPPEFYGFLTAMILAYALLIHLDKMLYQRIFKEWL